MPRMTIVVATLLALVTSLVARAEDSDEAKRFKERIELLETKLNLAEKEIELLKKENEQLRAKQPVVEKENAKRASLSDQLVVGTVISGDYRYANFDLDMGEYTLTIKERDGKKVKATSKIRSRTKNEPAHDGLFEGEIDGIKLTLRSVGSPTKSSVTLFLKGEGLEGTFNNSSGGKGTVGFKLTK